MTLAKGYYVLSQDVVNPKPDDLVQFGAAYKRVWYAGTKVYVEPPDNGRRGKITFFQAERPLRPDGHVFYGDETGEVARANPHLVQGNILLDKLIAASEASVGEIIGKATVCAEELLARAVDLGHIKREDIQAIAAEMGTWEPQLRSQFRTAHELDKAEQR